MPVPKWFIIAKNEYRTVTSPIRSWRPFLPFIIIGFLAVYVGYITPKIVGYFINEITAFIFSVAALAMIEIILFMFFFYFIFIPITITLRDINIEETEIFLSAPVKPSDVLLGTFMGQAIFYTIGITMITGIFTALLYHIGLDFIQMIIISAVFVLIFLSALWIGTVIAAVLRTKLGKIARGKDIGKALSFILALPMVALIYAIMGGGVLQALGDPNTSSTVRMVFNVFPSSWGAELMIGFALNPGNTGEVWFLTLTRFGGIILFFIAVLWIGTKTAERTYNLELSTFTASKAKKDGAFYKTIRKIGGGSSFGTILASTFKDFGRRFENLSKIAYMVGLVALILIFMAKPEEVFDFLFMSQIIFAMLAGIVVGEFTLRGKEALFIFRKAPNGVDQLLLGRLIHGWLIVIPIVTIVLTLVLTFIPGITLLAFIAFILVEIAFVQVFVAISLGIALLFPAFKEKESFINPMVVMMIATFLFLGLIIPFGATYGLILMFIGGWIIAVILLSMGKKRLEDME